MLALGGCLLPLSTLHTMPRRFQKWLANLRCIMSGTLVAQFSQLTFQKVLNIHVLLHRHTSPWTLKIFSFSGSTLSNYFCPLVHHSTTTGSENLDTQPETTAGGRMQELQHRFCTDVPLHLIMICYSHNRIH